MEPTNLKHSSYYFSTSTRSQSNTTIGGLKHNSNSVSDPLAISLLANHESLFQSTTKIKKNRQRSLLKITEHHLRLLWCKLCFDFINLLVTDLESLGQHIICHRWCGGKQR